MLQRSPFPSHCSPSRPQQPRDHHVILSFECIQFFFQAVCALASTRRRACTVAAYSFSTAAIALAASSAFSEAASASPSALFLISSSSRTLLVRSQFSFRFLQPPSVQCGAFQALSFHHSISARRWAVCAATASSISAAKVDCALDTSVTHLFSTATRMVFSAAAIFAEDLPCVRLYFSFLSLQLHFSFVCSTFLRLHARLRCSQLMILAATVFNTFSCWEKSLAGLNSTAIYNLHP